MLIGTAQRTTASNTLKKTYSTVLFCLFLLLPTAPLKKQALDTMLRSNSQGDRSSQWLNTVGETWPDWGKGIQKRDVEKAEIITSLTATDCCFRRHNSFSGAVDKSPIAPSLGTAAQMVRVYYCHRAFQPKAMCILVIACGRDWEKEHCLLTFTSIALRMNTSTQFISPSAAELST